MTDAPRKSRAKAAAPAVEADPAPEVAAAPAEPRRSDLALALKRPLSYGSHGPNVDGVMRALAQRGMYEGPIDGRYGTRLTRAVRQFQSSMGLRISGDVDSATWVALMGDYTPPPAPVAEAASEPEVPADAPADDTPVEEPASEPGDEVAAEVVEDAPVED